jgi:CheY-like chemotaxis protein
LRQVLLNLLGNAIKFTERGRVEVRVGHTSIPVPDERSLVQFEVDDTGIGIAPEVQAQLFQPFTQADSSTTRRFGGTGLGLVICRQIVELAGGTITLRSEPGRGSTFAFTYPLEAVNKPRARVDTPRKDDAASAVDSRLPHLRVLVAEDHAVNQRLVQLQLRKLGLAADVAATGIEALEALARAPYDLVLMDCQMPEMDGYETTRRIRADPRFAPVRIIAMTANAMQGDREKCLDAGMDDYVSKPIREPELRAALTRALAAMRDPDAEASVFNNQ